MTKTIEKKDEPTSREALAQAHSYVEKNLRDLAEEVLEWHKTGVLSRSKLRQLARILNYVGNASQALSMAENMVNRAALSFVVEERRDNDAIC